MFKHNEKSTVIVSQSIIEKSYCNINFLELLIYKYN